MQRLLERLPPTPPLLPPSQHFVSLLGSVSSFPLQPSTRLLRYLVRRPAEMQVARDRQPSPTGSCVFEFDVHIADERIVV